MSKVEGSIQAKRDAKGKISKVDEPKVVQLKVDKVSEAKPTEGTSKAE
jgi:hypothetical protein